MLVRHSRSAIVGSALLVAAAVLSLSASNRPFPALEGIAPSTFFIGAAAQLATCVLLIGLYVRAPRRSRGFLAVVYAAAAVVSLAEAMTAPLGPAAPSALHVTGQASPWLALVGDLGFALCAVLYTRFRTHDPELSVAQRYAFLRNAALPVLAVAVALVAAALLLHDRLPALLVDDELMLGTIGAGAFALALVATVVVATVRERDRDRIDAALYLSLLAIALSIGLHLVNGHRFTGAWYAARGFGLVASLFVLIAACRELLAWREQAFHLAALLATESQRSERHGRRLETLWRLVASNAFDDRHFLRTLLEEASTVVREGVAFHGVLAHVEGTELVIDVTVEAALGSDVPAEGSRYPLHDTLLSEVRRTGKTCSWSDVKTERRFASSTRLRATTWRAFIGAPFVVGGVPHFVSFVSPEPLAESFSTFDHAYVEVLASLCATRLHERAQVDRLRYQTEHDALTGLLNRSSFRAQGFSWLREGRPIAVIVADVDRFREINDTLGHHIGDALLVEVGAALGRVAAADEAVARLGGDTFGILVARADTRAALEARLLRYVEALRAPLGTGAQRIALSASFGIAMAPQDGSDFEQLLARADTAVYVAKESGRARWAFFDQRVETEFARTRGLKNELNDALARGEFELYFQPHVELCTGRVSGAEALIRWNHPVRGLVLPAEFIPFAESHGLAGAIGTWVMRETVRASARWRERDPHFRVWFNLSAEELSDPALPARFRELEGDLRGIGAEITETAAMRDVDQTILAIEALRAAGLGIALDDFGTGYSSLAHLKRLELDLVKIDRSFTAGIPTDAHDIAIVEAVVTLAASYGFETVAEGVENLAQIAYLTASGCTYAQGFSYARPMPAALFESWLADRTQVRVSA